jgi:AcrR family transcriptional regulator
VVRERPSADRIVDAAKRVFSRVGYGEASLRQLMAEAGVSTTAFYARFESKEAVLAAMLRQLIEELGAAIVEELAKSTSLEDGFERAIAALSKALIEHRVAVRLALTEAPASAVAMPALRDAYAVMSSLVARRLTRLAEKGTIKVTDPEATAWALVGALDMQISRWAVFDELKDRDLPNALRSTAYAIVPLKRKK